MCDCEDNIVGISTKCVPCTPKQIAKYNILLALNVEDMKDFNEEEKELYKESINEMYKPTGRTFFEK